VSTEAYEIHLLPETGFTHFIIPEMSSDIRILVKRGKPDISEFRIVFDVPASSDGSKLWSVYKKNGQFCIVCKQQNSLQHEMFAFFDITYSEWTIYVNTEHNSPVFIDPFAYPLGPIIMLYATQQNNGVMIHASAVKYSDKGYFFCGFSGSGKTTISNIFNHSGAEIINDDRLIIRKINQTYKIFNTPMYYEDIKKEIRADQCFILQHALKNTYQPLTGASGIAHISAFCMQHNYNQVLLNKMLHFNSELAGQIPIGILGFQPNHKIVDYIKSLD